MKTLLIEDQADITNDLLFYLSEMAEIKAKEESQSILNSIDLEILNPKIQEYLDSEEFDVDIEDDEFIKRAEKVQLSLKFSQELKGIKIEERKRRRFKRLLRKIKKLFCKAVAAGKDTIEDILGDVISKVVKLAVRGIFTVFQPLIINILAFLIKEGVEIFCKTDWEVNNI